MASYRHEAMSLEHRPGTQPRLDGHGRVRGRACPPAVVRYPSGPVAAPNCRWSRTAGCNRIKEVTMTRRIRLWITAVLSIAATALVVGLTVTAQAGVSHAHTHAPLAGLSFNALD